MAIHKDLWGGIKKAARIADDGLGHVPGYATVSDKIAGAASDVYDFGGDVLSTLWDGFSEVLWRATCYIYGKVEDLATFAYTKFISFVLKRFWDIFLSVLFVYIIFYGVLTTYRKGYLNLQKEVLALG